LHNGMLTFEGAKMSKSIGNVTLVHDLLEQHPPEALRYALLSAHYRQPLEWSEGLIEQCVRTLDRLYGTLRDLADIELDASDVVVPPAVKTALCDDLNTPSALSELAGLAAAARRSVDPAERRSLKAALLGGGKLLGLLQQDPADWFGRGGSDDEDARVQALVDERNAAKAARDFARADAIRKQLADEGVLLEDTAQGVRWRRAG
jgi:cysteinyl-tRNA synthetase